MYLVFLAITSLANTCVVRIVRTQFVEDFCTGKEGGDWEKRIPTICVGGAALQGRSSFGGLLRDLVRRVDHMRQTCKS